MAKPIHGPKAMAEGWALVGWLSLALGVLVLLILASRGIGTEGVRAVVRTTPKVSVILFLSAFVAAPLLKLWPSPFTHWLRRNRRYLGVSFAVAHFTHLGALIALVSTSRTAREDLDALTIIGGGLAYLFVAAMTATSFDRTAAWLGAGRWRHLHTFGLYYIWIIFLNSYISRAFQSPVYIPFALLLLGAMATRIFARVQRRASAPQVLSRQP